MFGITNDIRSGLDEDVLDEDDVDEDVDPAEEIDVSKLN